MRIPKINNDRMRRHRARGVPDLVVMKINHYDPLLMEHGQAYLQHLVEQWRQQMLIKHGKRPNMTFRLEIETAFDIDFNQHILRMNVIKIPYVVKRY